MAEILRRGDAEVLATPGAFDGPLCLRPRPSRWLAGYLLGVHLLAGAVVFALPLAWFWRLGLALLVAISALLAWWVHLRRRAPWSILEATWRARGWELVLATGEPVAARLLPSSHIGLHLIVLNFARGRWRRHALPLLPDSLDADTLRRLRARLRLARLSATLPPLTGSAPHTRRAR